MRFRKFLKPYKTRGSSFREHTCGFGGEDCFSDAKIYKNYPGRTKLALEVAGATVA